VDVRVSCVTVCMSVVFIIRVKNVYISVGVCAYVSGCGYMYILCVRINRIQNF